MVTGPPGERQTSGPSLALSVGIVSGSGHTSDLKIGTPVATLPGAGTGWSGVSILWLDEIANLIRNSNLSVAARALVSADCPWDTLACCWDVKQPTNKPTNLAVPSTVLCSIPSINDLLILVTSADVTAGTLSNNTIHNKLSLKTPQY